MSKEVKNVCCGVIFERGYAWECGKNAKYERDGKHYCGVHDPVAVAARRQKSFDKHKAEWDARAAMRRDQRDKQKNIEQEAARYRWLLKNHGLRLADIFHAAMPDEVSDCIDNEIEKEG